MPPSLAPAVAFGVATATVYLLSHPRWGPAVLDHPNERSLHARPVPRTGGLGIAAGALAGGLVSVAAAGGGPALGWILPCVGGVAAVSFVDDLRPLSPAIRLIVQLLAALGLVAAGLSPPALDLPGLSWGWPAWLGAGVAVLATIWMTNLYNFMDGMDGFAGGMAVFGFGSLAALGLMAGDPVFAGVNLAVVAAAAGFLLFNFPPARIFMGDVGSSTLGFLAAAFSLWGSREGLFPLWVAGLVFAPFVVDATVTLARRALAGERLWQAHRSHYYQRLVRLGWGHRRTVLAEYALMLGSAVSAVVVVRVGPSVQGLLLAGWASVYALLALGVHRLEVGAGASRPSEGTP